MSSSINVRRINFLINIDSVTYNLLFETVQKIEDVSIRAKDSHTVQICADKNGYDKLLNKLDEQSYHAESKIDKKEYIKIKNAVSKKVHSILRN
jgi:hypothetical protein